MAAGLEPGAGPPAARFRVFAPRGPLRPTGLGSRPRGAAGGRRRAGPEPVHPGAQPDSGGAARRSRRRQKSTFRGWSCGKDERTPTREEFAREAGRLRPRSCGVEAETESGARGSERGGTNGRKAGGSWSGSGEGGATRSWQSRGSPVPAGGAWQGEPPRVRPGVLAAAPTTSALVAILPRVGLREWSRCRRLGTEARLWGKPAGKGNEPRCPGHTEGS